VAKPVNRESNIALHVELAGAGIFSTSAEFANCPSSSPGEQNAVENSKSSRVAAAKD